eukprot:maker-scaffold_7-snap-gene-14.9-mRNA-1 protein AED:0.41 eAED:0.53 QI:0/0/0/0.5/1/1/2/0/152
MTLIDALSRVTMLKDFKNVNAINVRSLYVNAVVDTFVRQNGASQKFTVAYDPYTNGATEIQNKKILKNLRTLHSEYNLKVEDWSEVLAQVKYYHISKPLGSRKNLASFQILLGKKPRKVSLRRESNLKLTSIQLNKFNEVSSELEKEIRGYQ